MIRTIEAGRFLAVTGYSHAEIQEDITAAVDMVRNSAEAEGWRGIIVNRHERFLYTVNLSPEVPYGITAERDFWSLTRDARNMRHAEHSSKLHEFLVHGRDADLGLNPVLSSGN